MNGSATQSLSNPSEGFRVGLSAAGWPSPHEAGTERTIAELFAETVARWPDQVALLTAHETVTYRELDRRSSQLAQRLVREGAAVDGTVALCLGRNASLIVALLAIAKAGAAYLPLEPNYPAARIQFLLSDGAPRVLVTDREHASIVAGFAGPTLVLDEIASALSGEPAVPPVVAECGPESLAYVLYTSGSTGQPKGVLVPQRAIHRLVRDANYARLDETITILQAAPIAFDASTLEVWGALLNGGKVALYPDDFPTGRGLGEAIARFGVTTMWLTAALFNTVVDDDVRHLRGLTELLIGGEALSVPHVRKTLEALPELRLINGYGPTETTTFATCHLIERPVSADARSIPIGSALQKTRLYVLDAQRQLVPVGAEGELYIGGRGVALGYLHRPELTTEKFVADPFEPGQTLYRTGDLVRMDERGVVDFVGRSDQQVKIRGFRIELGEIEVALAALPHVKRAVVMAEARGGEKRLLGYLVRGEGAPDALPSQTSLKTKLAESLPDYMIPAFLTWVPEIPLTQNGKVDYRVLPKPSSARPDLDVPFVPPESELEKGLERIWSELLGFDDVGATDNVFDLGASSLFAVRAVAKIREKLGFELPVVKVFEYPTVRGQATFLENKGAGKATKRRTRPRSGGARGVAVIGMAGRFPGSASVDEFWKNLVAGNEGISQFKESELDIEVSASDRADPRYVRARGVLPDVDLFDAGFFGITPKEAVLLDPQQRLLFEVSWEALENSGYVPDKFDGSIGVFAGKYNNTYHSTRIVRRPDLIEEIGAFQVMALNEKDYVATRLAHRLNLTGPALSIHTACSTSLVAIVQAAKSLELGQCDIALAGGSSITVPVMSGHVYQDGAMLSKDGSTRSFDKSASGTVFSDGVAVVVLKRLEDAERDGDTIFAVIQGGAVNNDGADKASFTAPSSVGQTDVILRALDDAGVSAKDIGYVEAHGTATPLGDPIEVEALTRAYREFTPDRGFCALGSVKSNVGHLVIAAGATGLIKTALALHHELIPKNLHFNEPNPKLELETSPFFVAAENRSWPRGTRPRLAGVSSFGVGGTNAHAIVGEAPPRARRTKSRGSELLVLSARSEAALQASSARLAAHLQAHPEADLGDVAFTLHAGRKDFPFRRALVASTPEEAARLLSETKAAKVTKVASVPSLVFAFPGQGSQYLGMGAELYEEFSLFRAVVDECLEGLDPKLAGRLRDLVFARDPKEATEVELAQTSLAQPGIFLIEYGLAQLMLNSGLKPVALVGHSVGEFVAAVIAGVMKAKDALRLVAVRGELMQGQPPGGMLSVRKPAAEIVPLLPPELSLAAENSPQLCVVAGPHDALRAFAELLGTREIPTRELHTSHAFHSQMMEPAVPPFLAEIQKLDLRAPTLRIASTVTGTWLTDEEACDPGYWARQLREPVRFAGAVSALNASIPGALFLELGPRKVLTTLVIQQVADRTRKVAIAAGADRVDLGTRALLGALGELYSAGITIPASALHTGAGRVPLPTYPFERKRYWVEVAPERSLVTEPIATSSETPMTQSVDSAQKSQVLATLCSALEEISGIEVSPSEADVPFLELGLDSLFLTQFAISVQKKFSTKVSFRELQEEWPTLGSLADHLAPTVAAAAPPPRATPASPPVAGPSPQPLAAVPAPSAAFAAVPQVPAVNLAALSALGNGQNGGALSALIAAQLSLMTQQLALLTGASLPATAQFAPAPQPEATPAPLPTHSPAPAPVAQASNGAPAAADEEEGKGMVKYEVKKAFGAIARIHAQKRDEVTPKQRARLDAFMRRYTQKTKKSKEFTQESRAYMADPRVVTGFRPLLKELVYPIVVDKSKGSKVWDLDGNEYVDALNGFGLNLFGWQPDFVTKAIKDQLDQGHEIGPQHPLTADTARLVCEFTKFDRAAFCNTGSEAVMGCMRIARTVTGRSKIVMFTGSYHGIFDEVVVRGTKKLRSIPAAPGILPNASENMLVLEYGTPETMEILKAHAHELAAVMVEPVQSRRPDFRPKEFLEELRALTEREGIVLIFDEVVCGFRLGPGGSQEYYGIQADLASYGKVVGGGLPIGIIAGKRKFMDALDGGQWQFGDESTPPVGVTYFAGTFVRHPLAIASAHAVLTYLKEQGPELQRSLNTRVAAFADRLRSFIESVGAPIEIKSFASLWRYAFKEEYAWSDLFTYMMRERGVHIWDGFPCFFTTAHSDEDFATIEAAFQESVKELQEGEFIPSKKGPVLNLFDPSTPPAPGARLGRDPSGNPAWFVPHPERAGQFVKYEPS